MRYDRARKNLDRHPNYILAAYMASGTRASPRIPRFKLHEAPCSTVAVSQEATIRTLWGAG
jgi:hypothetical protein